jgi:hypothetical protein
MLHAQSVDLSPRPLCRSFTHANAGWISFAVAWLARACLPACRMLGTAFFHYAAALGILALCVLFCNLRRLSSTSLVSLPLAFCVVSVFVSFSFCVALPLPLLACGSSPLPSRVWAFAAPKFQRIRS